MEEFKGTPEEWIANHKAGTVHKPNGDIIAVLFHTDNETKKHVIPNVNLVSTAPELLDNLEALVGLLAHQYTDGMIGYDYFQDAQKAINKALGL
jgi:hypothetical protein